MALVLMAAALSGCKVNYGFSMPGMIDYSKVKTITIGEFQNRAQYVYAPLGVRFNEELKDLFQRQTKLQQVTQGGDLEIEGEITGYNQYNEAVAADGYASKTRLTITISMRYTDNVDNKEDTQQFSAFRTYDSTQLLTNVQDELIDQMIKELIDQIFNATVGNW